MFSGPLPPPEMLEHYDRICPGFAERSLGLVERQSEHRQGIEREMLRGKLRHEAIGQGMAFTLALVAFVIGGGAVYLHQVTAGATIMGIDASTIIGMFIYREVRENVRRKENLPPSMPNL